MAEYQSREKLISELEATKARLAALDQPVDAREAALMRQLDEAKAELAQAKPAAETSFPAGAAPAAEEARFAVLPCGKPQPAVEVRVDDRREP